MGARGLPPGEAAKRGTGPLAWFASLVAVYHLVVVAQGPTWLGIFLPT